jgi:hypothetical protein
MKAGIINQPPQPTMKGLAKQRFSLKLRRSDQ